MTNYNELRDGQEFYSNGFKEGYKQAIRDGKTNFSRQTGEWILGERNGEGYDYYCSRCMHVTNENINEIRFCPKCGADMRKGGTE